MSESRDNQTTGVGDHDATYEWGHRWSTEDCTPFTLIMYGRLLILRSLVREGLRGVGDMSADPEAPYVADPYLGGPSD